MGQEEREAAAAHADAQRPQPPLLLLAAASAPAGKQLLQAQQPRCHRCCCLEIFLSQAVWLCHQRLLQRAAAAAAGAACANLHPHDCLSGDAIEAQHPPLLPAAAAPIGTGISRRGGGLALEGGWVGCDCDAPVAAGAVGSKDSDARVAPPAAILVAPPLGRVVPVARVIPGVPQQLGQA